MVDLWLVVVVVILMQGTNQITLRYPDTQMMIVPPTLLSSKDWTKN